MTKQRVNSAVKRATSCSKKVSPILDLRDALCLSDSVQSSCGWCCIHEEGEVASSLFLYCAYRIKNISPHSIDSSCVLWMLQRKWTQCYVKRIVHLRDYYLLQAYCREHCADDASERYESGSLLCRMPRPSQCLLFELHYIRNAIPVLSYYYPWCTLLC
jgi:hypothetical protein